jgi:hypothetical protein
MNPMPINPVARAMVRAACAALLIVFAQPAWAQSPQPQGQQPPPGDPQHGRPPPPHAYEDCRGKRAGDTVQHKTPRGTGPAVCMDSPEGLVARPNPPPGAAPPPPPPPQR